MDRTVKRRGGQIVSAPALPSMVEMAINLGRAAGAILIDKARHPDESIYVPVEVEKERLALCQACERFLPKEQRCSLCGCFTSGEVFNKVKYRTQECPDKPSKWRKWRPDNGALNGV